MSSRAEAHREQTKRRKMKAVMEILQGRTSNSTVDVDRSYVWKQCWERCVTLFGLNEQRARAYTVGTLYDVMLQQPELVQKARDAPSIQINNNK